MNSKLGISVIIPTAQPRFLGDCLAGLACQRDRRFEVIVVENGPSDSRVRADVSAFATGIPAKYTYQQEAGLNRARNRGCREARYEIIALIDDDCIASEDWIAAIIEHHTRFPSAGVIGGQIKLRFLAEPPAWLAGEFLLNLCRVHWSEEARPVRDEEFIAGANMSFLKSVFDQVGGFSEAFGLTGRQSPQLANDETLFNRTAERFGCARILYAPDIVVCHQIPAERLQYEYHEQRRYGQGVSDIDLAIHEHPNDPWVRHERFAEVVQHQQWHRAALLKASGNLGAQDARAFRTRLIQSRIAYLAGAQDRVLNRFTPGLLGAALSVDEVRPYRAGCSAADRCSSAQTRDDLHLLLESMLYRERPRPLQVPEPFDRGLLHARVAFLKGFKDRLCGRDKPAVESRYLHELELLADRPAS